MARAGWACPREPTHRADPLVPLPARIGHDPVRAQTPQHRMVSVGPTLDVARPRCQPWALPGRGRCPGRLRCRELLPASERSCIGRGVRGPRMRPGLRLLQRTQSNNCGLIQPWPGRSMAVPSPPSRRPEVLPLPSSMDGPNTRRALRAIRARPGIRIKSARLYGTIFRSIGFRFANTVFAKNACVFNSKATHVTRLRPASVTANTSACLRSRRQSHMTGARLAAINVCLVRKASAANNPAATERFLPDPSMMMVIAPSDSATPSMSSL